jgi:hypothetical protein
MSTMTTTMTINQTHFVPFVDGTQFRQSGPKDTGDGYVMASWITSQHLQYRNYLALDGRITDELQSI